MVLMLVDTFNTFAKRCEKHKLTKYLLFAALTLMIVILYGYYFGTFDQTSHIPFLKKTVDPTLFPGDRYFDLRFTHYSFFWFLFIPFYQWGILEVTMFVGHIVSVYLTVWAVWKLSFTLFKNALSSLLATCAMVFPHFGFSGFPFFEFSILNRTVALPIELFALSWYLEKKTLRAVFVLGLMFNIHVISVNFLMAMILLDMLIRVKNVRDVGRLFKHIGVFLLGAAPVLIWKFTQSGIGLRANQEWFDILDRGVFAHLFHFVSLQAPYINLVTLGGLSTVILFFLFVKHKQGAKTSMDVSMMHFVYAGVCILLVQLVASYLAPSAIIIAAQITRVGMFMVLFCYLYGAHYVAQLYGKVKPHAFLAWIAALLLSFSPGVLLLFYVVRKTANRLWGARIGIAVLGLLYAVSLMLALYFKLWSPGMYIFPPKNAFNDVQLWAKNNTPKDAVFITPPDKFWIYDTEWRVLSERSSVSTISELLEAAFDPNYISYWKPRFEDVAPGALAKFRGNFYENLLLTRKAYATLTTADFVRLADTYDASYVVVPKPHLYNLPPVYENDEYRVYDVR